MKKPVLLAMFLLLLAVCLLLATVNSIASNKQATETPNLPSNNAVVATMPLIAVEPVTSLPVGIQSISVTVVAESLNLRECGSLKCRIITALPKGTIMEFDNLCEKGWAKLQDGWVYAKYIAPEVCEQ